MTTQKQVADIILQLKKENKIINPLRKEKRFMNYDKVLLNAILKKEFIKAGLRKLIF